MRDDVIETLDPEYQQLLAALPHLPDHAKAPILKDLELRIRLAEKEKARNTFMGFVNRVWPEFIGGSHHSIMAKAFEKVARGENKRLIINMPPRHTKSEFASYLLPAWYLGKFPNRKVIQASNTGELAVGFGRKVRNLVDSEVYKDIFPELELQQDSKAAGRWNTSKGGDYFAIGVGGTVTGKGANLLIIDDPHSEQEAALAASNPDVYDKVTEWYTSGPRQRLQPGGAIIIVMCMTGDTRVLLADGGEKLLKDIRPGDMVATFDKGRLAVSRVNNWRSSGVDSIYKIQTQSGRILRANERHPFLVMNEGVLEWTRLKHLKPGDLLVSLKGADGPRGQKQNPESAIHAKQKTPTTGSTQTRQPENLGTTASGRALHALSRGATKLLQAVGYVVPITAKNTPPRSQQSQQEGIASNTAMGSPLSSMKQWLQSAVTNAMSVASCLRGQHPRSLGWEALYRPRPRNRKGQRTALQCLQLGSRIRKNSKHS